MRLIAILFALLLAVPAAAQTRDEQARLAWTAARGKLLFEVDRAAWITTDDLAERVGDLGRAGVRGWTVEREGAGYRVVYFAGEGDGRVALYRAFVANNRIVSAELLAEGARPPLTALQRRIADARGQAAGAGRRSCAGPGFNAAVIPPERPDGPIDVYLLTPQTRADLYPAGGHFLITLSPAGEIVSQRAFTNSCIELSTAPAGEDRVAGLVITHLLDPVPTEIHVFLSIWTGLPLYVSTGEPLRIWEVLPGGITLVRRDD